MAELQKVLIVDDEPRNQRILAEILEGVADFRLAANGEEALALVATYRPDLVLLDIMMPGIDGYQVCTKIKGDPEDGLIKVILVSGKAMIEERLKGYEVQADDYITKPFVPEELLAKVKVFLRLAQVELDLGAFNRTLEAKVDERTAMLLATEAKLLTTAKMSALGEMAGGIAHEINTPLGTISLVAEQLQDLLEEEPIDRKNVSRMLDVIGKTVRRISGIIKGLRTFSRDGSLDPFEAVSVSRIVQDTLALCHERLKNSGVQVRIGPISDDRTVQCRFVQISQVLLNLVSNACDAIAPLPEKWIEITAVSENGRVLISVMDSGSGIPKEVHAKLFQPFFTTKAIGKGTGLGLSISKGIMNAHQGDLRIDENCVNTRFLIELAEGETKLVEPTWKDVA